VQRLKIEARELQQRYDEVKATMRTFAINQRLAKLQETKALKEKVDAAQHMETLLKARLKPWLDEACVLMITTEGKLVVYRKHRNRYRWRRANYEAAGRADEACAT